jgi:hypothetical protein
MRAVKDSLATPWREVIQRSVRRMRWRRAVETSRADLSGPGAELGLFFKVF